jgi:hypothetical protein
MSQENMHHTPHIASDSINTAKKWTAGSDLLLLIYIQPEDMTPVEL